MTDRKDHPPPRVLVVDDEAAMREVLGLRLSEWGYDVEVAAGVEEARAKVEAHSPRAVISDVVLPEASGLELLSVLQAGDRDRPVILITAYGTVDTAVEAMKRGARDFLTKPLDYPRLRTVLAAACTPEEEDEAAAGAGPAAESPGLGPLVGASRPMRELFELIRVVADSDASALVTGESGTGKELVARTLHELSRRRGGPFVAVNTAALPDGLTESALFGHERGAFTGALEARPGCFEQAHRGTLFLDEIAEMPASLQPKLLRVLEDGRVRRLGASREIAFDVRLVAATNRDPGEAVREGHLRRDLYYRLNVFTLAPPPLRQRRDDIPLLTAHFLGRFNRRHGAAVPGIDDAAAKRLASYSWPGNVRELRNAMERAVILARQRPIALAHLPPSVRDPNADPGEVIVLPPEVTAAEAEKIVLLETLKRTGDNKAEAARRLGVDVKTIRNRLRAYGLGPKR